MKVRLVQFILGVVAKSKLLLTCIYFNLPQEFGCVGGIERASNELEAKLNDEV